MANINDEYDITSLSADQFGSASRREMLEAEIRELTTDENAPKGKGGARSKKVGARALAQTPDRIFNPADAAVKSARAAGGTREDIEELKRQEVIRVEQRSAEVRGRAAQRPKGPSSVEALAAQLGVNPKSIKVVDTGMAGPNLRQAGWPEGTPIPERPGRPPETPEHDAGNEAWKKHHEALLAHNVALEEYLNYEELNRDALERSRELTGEARPSPQATENVYHVDRGDGKVEVYSPSGKSGFVKIREQQAEVVRPLTTPTGIPRMWEQPRALVVSPVESQEATIREIARRAVLEPEEKDYFDKSTGIIKLDLPKTRRARRQEAETQGQLRTFWENFRRKGDPARTVPVQPATKQKSIKQESTEEDPTKEDFTTYPTERHSPIVFATPKERKAYIKLLGAQKVKRDKPDMVKDSPSWKKAVREAGPLELAAEERSEMIAMMADPVGRQPQPTKQAYSSRSVRRNVQPNRRGPLGRIEDPETFVSTVPIVDAERGAANRFTREFTQQSDVEPDTWSTAAANASLHGMPHHAFVKRWMDFKHGRSTSNPVETYAKPPSDAYRSAMAKAGLYGVSSDKFHVMHQRHLDGMGEDPIQQYKDMPSPSVRLRPLMGTITQRSIVKPGTTREAFTPVVRGTVINERLRYGTREEAQALSSTLERAYEGVPQEQMESELSEVFSQKSGMRPVGVTEPRRIPYRNLGDINRGLQGALKGGLSSQWPQAPLAERIGAQVKGLKQYQVPTMNPQNFPEYPQEPGPNEGQEEFKLRRSLAAGSRTNFPMGLTVGSQEMAQSISEEVSRMPQQGRKRAMAEMAPVNVESGRFVAAAQARQKGINARQQVANLGAGTTVMGTTLPFSSRG